MPQLNKLVNKPYVSYYIIHKALELVEEARFFWKSKKAFLDNVTQEIMDIGFRMGYDFTVPDLFP